MLEQVVERVVLEAQMGEQVVLEQVVERVVLEAQMGEQVVLEAQTVEKVVLVLEARMVG